jgi:HSP20 family protein
MAIQKFRNPLTDETSSSNFSSMLDRFFNESVNSRGSLATFTPHVETSETEQGYEIEVSLPGLKKEDIQVDFHDGRLTITGERKFSDEKRSKKYHLIESQYGSFTRSFYLPDTINAEAIEADYEDGLLRISVPKDTRRSTRQQIQIKGKEHKAENASPKQEKTPGKGKEGK